MPQVQGAVFIDNCYKESTCFGTDVELSNNTKFENKTEDELNLLLPWQHVLIEENYFYNNWANVIMDEHQTQKQASSLYIRQGRNN